MEIVRLSPNIGANIAGIDLSKPLSSGVIENIKAVWDEHLVVRFRNQSIRDDDLLRFSKYFGNLIRQARIHTGLHSYRNTPRLM